MPEQGIQNQRSGFGKNGPFVSKDKHRTDTSSLATFTRDLDRQLNKWIEDVGIVFRYLAENALKHSLALGSGKVQFKFIDVTPAPILTALERSHDGMLGGMKMFGSM